MNLKHRQLGLAAVELTVLTPFIFLFLYMAIDFGRVMSESIVTTSSANSASGYGSIHVPSLDVVMDHNGMQTIAEKDSISLSNNPDEESAITVTTERVCRCYDPDLLKEGGTLTEPTSSICSNTCSDHKEVYLQTTVIRNFHSFSNHSAMPEMIVIQRTARLRVQ
ncbi:pilus assembly protein [Vibrio sp. 16]|uniref:TadE family protein n=1 Tax=Vibrio sp. 16 TaxID=391586 RepID=UPI002FF2750A